MITLYNAPFDPAQEIAAFSSNAKNAGAIVTFVGKVRDQAKCGASVSALFLEHYPGLTERSLQAIVDDACNRWALQSIRVVHRYGTLQPDEAIVLVCCASAHRRDAFEAADFLMDYLKTQALFWKKEISSDGAQWIEPRPEDYEDAQRWQQER